MTLFQRKIKHVSTHALPPGSMAAILAQYVTYLKNIAYGLNKLSGLRVLTFCAQ